MYCISVSFVRYGWASCSAGPLTSDAGGFRPADAKINHGLVALRRGRCPGSRHRPKACRSTLWRIERALPANDLGAASPGRAQRTCGWTCRNASGLYLRPRLSALLAPIRTARPLAGERAVRIAGHHQDGGPTLEQAGHHQRVTDHLGDANLLAVV